MKTYYDQKTNFSIIVDKNEIIAIQKKSLFTYDVPFIYDDSTYLRYAMMGTAYHSGKLVNHMVRYLNNEPSLVNLSGAIKMGILQHYSVCDKELNQPDFIEKNFFSFYTQEVELMPLLGFVVRSEKLQSPSFSWYEQQNILNGSLIIEADENLSGDNLGQMCQLLCTGASVLNNVCKTVLKNPFYSKTLSLTPIGKGNPVIFMRLEDFNKYFKNVPPCLKDIALFHPITIECNEEQIKLFGYNEVSLFLVSEYTQATSHCIGFIKLFSEGKHDFFYSYEDIPTEFEAGYNGIFKNQERICIK